MHDRISRRYALFLGGIKIKVVVNTEDFRNYESGKTPKRQKLAMINMAHQPMRLLAKVQNKSSGAESAYSARQVVFRLGEDCRYHGIMQRGRELSVIISRWLTYGGCEMRFS
jgi:hypothetical protein